MCDVVSSLKSCTLLFSLLFGIFVILYFGVNFIFMEDLTVNKFEDELADSIAQIIDSETQDAKLYVDTHDDDSDFFEDEDEEEKVVIRRKKNNNKKNNIFMIGGIALGALLLITVVVVTMLIIKNNTKKSFSYNYKKAQGYFNNNDYEKALMFFEKASNNASTKDNASKIELYMYIYDCYNKLKKPYGQIDALKKVLELDKFNEEALTSLALCYNSLSNGAELNHLLETYKNSRCYEILREYAVAKPVANIGNGTYDSNIKVELSCDHDSNIYYTLDGSVPSAYATLYSEPIEISSGNTELKAIAVNNIGVKSEVSIYNYEIKYGKPAKPVLSAISGTYTDSTKISITNLPEGYSAYYTWDGTSPNKESTEYDREEKIEMKPGNNILSVIVYSQYDQASDVATYIYDVKVATKYTYVDGLDAIVKKLIEKKTLKSSTTLENGEDCRFVYNTMVKNEDKYIYIFYFDLFNDSKYVRQDYMYGVDSTSLETYKVTKDGSNFKFEAL